MKRIGLFLLTLGLGILIWYLPHPEGVNDQAWHLFAIFVATIFGIVLKPFPMGAVAFLGLLAALLTKTLTFAQGFSGFASEVVWLVVLAFFIARGVIATGLGMRIAYIFLRLFGKHSLGLGYGLVLTELLISPAVPSVTARTGGIIYPILKSIASVLGSEPGETSRRIGSFLTQNTFQTTCVTSAMFLTAMAGNPMIAQFAESVGVNLSWGVWALGALVPGLISLLVIPYLIYLLDPPTLKKTADVPELARKKLEEMGKMTCHEWIMAGTFFLLLFLWIFGDLVGVKATVTALLGVMILVVTGVLSWKDILKEESAWDILIWFSILIVMATFLNQFGLIAWFSQWIVGYVGAMGWMTAFALLAVIYYYSHYFFASTVAHASAMYPAFLGVAVAVGVPPMVAAIALAAISNLFGGLTHYGCGPAPILFGGGYVTVANWWRVGFIVSLVNLVIWLGVGGLWWKFLGFF